MVLSSISEALPFSVIEAMFCGRPVVGTDVGGVPEVIGQTGRVVMPRDAQAMAAACIELLSDFQLCQDLGVRAREHALANFTLQKSVDSYRHLYQELNRQSQRVKAAVPNRVKRLNPTVAQPKPQLAKLGAGKWATLSHWLLNTPAESMSGELYD